MSGTDLPPERYEKLLRDVAPPEERQMSLSEADIDHHYNKDAFLFHHRLDKHPLFQLDSLFELCRRLPKDSVKLRKGSIPKDTDFDSSLARYQSELSLEETIAQFEQNKSYIAIYNPEFDAEYRAVIEGLLAEIAVAVRDSDPDFTWYSTYIFLSTEGSLTPYHMDREMNFLFQIRGNKTARLWGRLDDAVMTSEQRDTLLTERQLARPGYDESIEQRARIFELSAGNGVHHPFIAPHLITTHSALSISLAITYRTALSDLWTDAHHCNYLLRRTGLNPAAVGNNLSRDRRKAKLVRRLRSIKRRLRR